VAGEPDLVVHRLDREAAIASAKHSRHPSLRSKTEVLVILPLGGDASTPPVCELPVFEVGTNLPLQTNIALYRNLPVAVSFIKC
jgi:hypothetical protein